MIAFKKAATQRREVAAFFNVTERLAYFMMFLSMWSLSLSTLQDTFSDRSCRWCTFGVRLHRSRSILPAVRLPRPRHRRTPAGLDSVTQYPQRPLYSAGRPYG